MDGYVMLLHKETMQKYRETQNTYKSESNLSAFIYIYVCS